MTTRRKTLAGGVAFAVTTALPDAPLADGLTAEERRLLDRLPPDVDATGRAFVLEGLRDPDPPIRDGVRLLLEMTPKGRQAALAWVEAEFAATRT